MAKVAAPGTLPSTSLQMSGDAFNVATMVKRKTPSELRGEQLKRTNIIDLVDEPPAPSTSKVGNGFKKPDQPSNARYIDTCMGEAYPVKKSRLRMLSRKQNAKENSSVEQPSSLKICTLSELAAKRTKEISCLEKPVASVNASSDDGLQAFRTLEKFSQGTFRSVTELSEGERLPDLTTLDLGKALKGLAAKETISAVPVKSFERLDDPSLADNFCSEFHVPGQKIPLDFTLKTYMRLESSSSVNWFYRSIMCGTYNGMPQFTSQFGCSRDQNISSSSDSRLTSQVLNCKALHSWIYPQSNLPPSLLSFLTSSASDGVEMDFLRKRQLAWEDSFRSLYYMFRKSVFDIFYVCTSHFVVMFAAADGLGSTSRSCNAYISRSTRALRSVLKENDVCFSMPLCHSKVEEVSKEDLVELSEIEKHNLGQARRLNSLPEVDNTPQSLLAFSGNENVHGLYEILLNYRSFLTFLMGMDVPTLYSPLPFQNAALSAPEVRCTESKKVNYVAALPDRSVLRSDSIQNSSTSTCYSIELRDAFLPPWIISNMCSIMVSEGRSFEASFTTEHTSTGLNIALEAVAEKSGTGTDVAGTSQETGNTFGIQEAINSPYLHSGLLKGLKYCNDSYTVSLSPV